MTEWHLKQSKTSHSSLLLNCLKQPQIQFSRGHNTETRTFFSTHKLSIFAMAFLINNYSPPNKSLPYNNLTLSVHPEEKMSLGFYSASSSFPLMYPYFIHYYNTKCGLSNYISTKEPLDLFNYLSIFRLYSLNVFSHTKKKRNTRNFPGK